MSDDLPEKVRERVERRTRYMPAWLTPHVTEGQFKLATPKFWSIGICLPREVNGLTRTDRLVMLTLASYMDEIGVTWVSIVTLARAADVERSTVHRCLDRVAWRNPGDPDWDVSATEADRKALDRAWLIIRPRGDGRSHRYQAKLPSRDPAEVFTHATPPVAHDNTPPSTHATPPVASVDRGVAHDHTEASNEVPLGSSHVSGQEAGPPDGVPAFGSPSENGQAPDGAAEEDTEVGSHA